MGRGKVYKNVGSLRPGRSVFDLSYEKKFTCDMGQIIPIMCDEVVPGDFFKIGNQAVVRFQPLVAPVLHQIDMTVHYFFVPNRIMFDDWIDFITGGVDGQDATALPTWEPTDTSEGSLWDFMGFPIGVDPDGVYPVDFPRRAYNMVWNEYFRDETLQNKVLLSNETILNRCWEKDYFTSALLSQQRGTAPALPISGTTKAVWGDPVGGAPTAVSYDGVSGTRPVNAGVKTFLESNVVDLSTASTFDVADLRLAFQIQRWQERNNRAGVRYPEFLKAHYGVTIPDSTLQRPDYIGGSKAPIIISEVLQTSETSVNSPQGNLGGHGITISDAYCGKYHVKEFGVIIGLMSIMPKPAYHQGIDRQWIKSTRYDYYSPEFANLSEQEIIQAEIFASGVDTENLTPFGYQGHFDEMRTKKNMVCSAMRPDAAISFDYWHLARTFAAAPTLDDTFVECDCTGADMKRIFAVPSEPGLIVSFANIIKAFRPLPVTAEPGLIDHD